MPLSCRWVNKSITHVQHRAGCVQGVPESCLSMNLCPELGVPNCATTSGPLNPPYIGSPILGRPAPTGFARESDVHQRCWPLEICMYCHMAKPSRPFGPGHFKHCRWVQGQKAQCDRLSVFRCRLLQGFKIKSEPHLRSVIRAYWTPPAVDLDRTIEHIQLALQSGWS